MSNLVPQPTAPLPGGSLTFLFTDIEGSTRLWEQYLGAMSVALARHNSILSEVLELHGGHVFKTVGDGFCAAFHRPEDALNAAVACQRAISAQDWGEVPPLRIRIALYTGPAQERGGDYFGPSLNHVSRLLSAGYGGQTLIASSTEQWIREKLPEDISLRSLGEHRLRDLQTTERLYQVVIPGIASDFPPLKTLTHRRNNLPLQPTSFIGRRKEIADASALLRRPDVRLVTLTGPGGAGKTRLALQLAAEMIDEHEDGVFFVSLASISDPHMVVSAIEQALSLRESAGRAPLAVLLDHLVGKRMLLVLDNSEQLLGQAQYSPVAQLFSELFSGTQHLKLLVTSRAALHLYGEHEYAVPPMTVPAPMRKPVDSGQLSALTTFEAVRLFMDRAQAVKPDFAATIDNIRDIVEICRRLDGLPLAMELAAARVRILQPRALLERLDNRLKLLTGGPQDLPPRQRTLRAAIDWSYNLLGEEEKVAFAALSLFSGGCTLEGAEALISHQSSVVSRQWMMDHRQPITGADVLDLISSLLDKSLLRREDVSNEPRFTMLETIREYARERLEESGCAQAARGEHLRFYVALSERAEPLLVGPDQQTWLERLEAEHENLRAALEWSKGTDKESYIRLAAALWRFWNVRGHLSEGQQWLEGGLAIARDSDLPQSLCAKVRDGAGTMALDRGDYDRAVQLLNENLTYYRSRGDRRGVAYLLSQLGVVATNRGDYTDAELLFGGSLSLRRLLEDRAGVAASLNNLAHVATLLGDYGRAQGYLEESLTIFRTLGQLRGISIALNNLGRVAQEMGNDQLARTRYEESLAIKRELGDKVGMASSLQKLADLARGNGDYAQAHALYVQSLELFHEAGDRQSMALCLVGLADVALSGDEFSKAARLLATAESLLKSIGGALDPTAAADYDRIAAAVRADFGQANWETASPHAVDVALEQLILELHSNALP